MKYIKKSVNAALFITGVIMVALLVVAERLFGVLSGVNVLFAGLPIDPMTSLLALMGGATVILMSLFSVMLSKKMKLKLK
jgi:hypothetical protein